MAMTRLGDDLFNQFFQSSWPMQSGAVTSAGAADRWVRPISIDVCEKEKNYELKADIPGVDKKDIQLSIDNDVLTIAVEKKSEKEESSKEGEAVTWHRSERSSSYSRRSLRMPDAADLQAIKAKYENGVLCLDIPKSAKARTHTVAIE